MSGVKNKIMAESKGLEQPTNQDYRDDGVSTPTEMAEKYGEEKHKSNE